MEKVPTYEDMYGSTYIGPDDFTPGQEERATLTSFEARELYCPGAAKNWKITCTFSTKRGPAKKRVCINKTSAKALATAWGKKFENWMNKPVLIKRGLVNSRAAVLVTPLDAPAIPASHDESEEV